MASYEKDTIYAQKTETISCAASGFGGSTHLCLGNTTGSSDDGFCKANSGAGFVCDVDGLGNVLAIQIYI